MSLSVILCVKVTIPQFDGPIDSDSDYDPKHPRPSASRRRHKKKQRPTRGQQQVAESSDSGVPSPVVAARRHRRVFLPNAKKLATVDEFESMLTIVSWDEARVAFHRVFPAVSFPQMLRWRRRVEELRVDAASAACAKKFVSGRCIEQHGAAWFPDAEGVVFTEFKAAREAGLKCDGLWFQVRMRAALQSQFPDGSADDFRAGEGWRAGFYKRFGLSTRVATNIMPLSVKERVPMCLSFYAVIQRECAAGGGMNADWGRFKPHHRFNADEVPVEFRGSLTRTAEMRGAKRVWLKHPKHKVENRECTMVTLVCAGSALPFGCMVLRAAPKRLDVDTVDPCRAANGPTQHIVELLRSKYPNVDIYCQHNGYMDAVTFLTWFKLTFLPSAGNIPALLVLDNLTAHGTPEMREFAAFHNVLLLFTPPNTTDMVQPVDIGIGHAIKGRMKRKFAEHFSVHSDQWQRDEIKPVHRKKLYVRWLSEATREFYADGGQDIVEKVCGGCGLLTPLHEQDQQLRKIAGHNEPIIVEWSEK